MSYGQGLGLGCFDDCDEDDECDGIHAVDCICIFALGVGDEGTGIDSVKAGVFFSRDVLGGHFDTCGDGGISSLEAIILAS